MKWILLMIGILGTMYLIYMYRQKQSVNSKLTRFFFPALLFKVVAGFSTGLVYTFYYDGSGDTFAFYNASWQLAESMITDPIGFSYAIYSGKAIESALLSFDSRTTFFVLLLTIPALFSGGVYWICLFYTALLSFVASWYLIASINSKYQNSSLHFAILAAFLFFPSLAFWTSGIFKECATTSAIFLLAGGFLKIDFDSKVNDRLLIMLVLAALVLVGVKYYLAALFLPLWSVGILNAWLAQKNYPMKQRLRLGLGAMVFLMIITFYSHPNLDFIRLPEVIEREYNWKTGGGNSESHVVYNDLDNGWVGLASNTPKAFFTGLFMPLNFNFQNPLQLISSGENLILLLSTIMGAIGLFKVKRVPWHAEVWLLLLFIFVASTLLALTSPNFGTLSRYKVAYSPFFFFLTLLPAIKAFTKR